MRPAARRHEASSRSGCRGLSPRGTPSVRRLGPAACRGPWLTGSWELDHRSRPHRRGRETWRRGQSAASLIRTLAPEAPRRIRSPTARPLLFGAITMFGQEDDRRFAALASTSTSWASASRPRPRTAMPGRRTSARGASEPHWSGESCPWRSRLPRTVRLPQLRRCRVRHCLARGSRIPGHHPSGRRARRSSACRTSARCRRRDGGQLRRGIRPARAAWQIRRAGPLPADRQGGRTLRTRDRSWRSTGHCPRRH